VYRVLKPAGGVGREKQYFLGGERSKRPGSGGGWEYVKAAWRDPAT